MEKATDALMTFLTARLNMSWEGACDLEETLAAYVDAHIADELDKEFGRGPYRGDDD